MRAQGKTVIIAEHRLYYIMDAVDRVVYLENGKIAGDFTPEQLMSLTKNERQSMDCATRACGMRDRCALKSMSKSLPCLRWRTSLSHTKSNRYCALFH